VALKARKLGLTDKHRDNRADTLVKLVERHLEPSAKGYAGVMRGYRADLGPVYFRSRWEANIARYLTFTKRRWVYEPTTFWFLSVKRGVRSYTPDFYLPDEDVYIEVKGYMDARSKTKLRRMKHYYPDVHVLVWDSERYQSIQTTAAMVIPNWEYKGVSHITGKPPREKRSEPGTKCGCGCAVEFDGVSPSGQRQLYATAQCRIRQQNRRTRANVAKNRGLESSDVTQVEAESPVSVEPRHEGTMRTVEPAIKSGDLLTIAQRDDLLANLGHGQLRRGR
jgi:hypothetical protein